MADVRTRIGSESSASSAGSGGRDRGQLILVTGLAVAVTLVALVLLLNTVIYTQNLATRGPQVEDGEAIDFRNEAVAGVGATIDAENRAEYGTYGEVSDSVEAAVPRYDDLHSRYAIERGIVADVEEDTLSTTEGRLLRQDSTNASRNFTDVDGDGSWTLVSDAGDGSHPDVRSAEVTVSRENLSTDSSSAFAVHLDGDDEWRAHVYEDGDEIVVAVKNGTDSDEQDVCSLAGPEATIDLTEGRINGTACPGLVWAKGVDSPYDVEFENGAEVTGTYSMTVNTSASDVEVEETNFADPGDSESPRSVPAVYSATFDIHFESPNLEFHTRVRSAPGEPR